MMAVFASRHWTLLLLLTGVAVCYATGFMAGFWSLVGVGAILELALWREVLKAMRRR